LYRISESEKLRDEVKVRDRLKETYDVSKIYVYVYLFKKGLRKSISIFFVFFIGPIEDLLTTFPDSFVGEMGLSITPCFLSKTKGVAPNWRFAGYVGEVNLYRNPWIASCSQATNL